MLDKRAKAITEAIEAAFRDVPRGRITLHEAEVIDDYGSQEQRLAARELDTESRWEDVPDAHLLECPTALCHLDPESWRYYIARYMTWSLRHFRTNSSMVSDSTIYTLAPYSEEPDLAEYAMQRFRQLDDAQSRAVCRFLQYMAENGDHADDRVAAEALQKHWGRFSSETGC